MDTLHALNPKYPYPTLQHHQDPETRNLGLEDRTLDLNRHSPQLKLKHPKSFLLLLLWVKVTFLFGILSRQHFHKGIFWQELTCKIVARPSFPVVNATFLFLWHSFPQTFPPTQSLLAHLVVLLHIFCCSELWIGLVWRDPGSHWGSSVHTAEGGWTLEPAGGTTAQHPPLSRTPPKVLKMWRKASVRWLRAGLSAFDNWKPAREQHCPVIIHHRPGKGFLLDR